MTIAGSPVPLSIRTHARLISSIRAFVMHPISSRFAHCLMTRPIHIPLHMHASRRLRACQARVLHPENCSTSLPRCLSNRRTVGQMRREAISRTMRDPQKERAWPNRGRESRYCASRQRIPTSEISWLPLSRKGLSCRRVPRSLAPPCAEIPYSNLPTPGLSPTTISRDRMNDTRRRHQMRHRHMSDIPRNCSPSIRGGRYPFHASFFRHCSKQTHRPGLSRQTDEPCLCQMHSHWTPEILFGLGPRSSRSRKIDRSRAQFPRRHIFQLP